MKKFNDPIEGFLSDMKRAGWAPWAVCGVLAVAAYFLYQPTAEVLKRGAAALWQFSRWLFS